MAQGQCCQISWNLAQNEMIVHRSTTFLYANMLVAICLRYHTDRSVPNYEPSVSRRMAARLLTAFKARSVFLVVSSLVCGHSGPPHLEKCLFTSAFLTFCSLGMELLAGRLVPAVAMPWKDTRLPTLHHNHAPRFSLS